MGLVRIDRDPVDDRPSRPQGTIDDRRAIGTAGHRLQSVQHPRQLLADRAEIRHSADGRAIGIDGDFVIGAEGAFERRKCLVHLLHGNIRHAQIVDHSRRQRERVAREVIQGLLFSVLVYHKIFVQQSIGQAARIVGHPHWNQNLVDLSHNPEKLVVAARSKGRRGAIGHRGRGGRRGAGRIVERDGSRHTWFARRCRGRGCARGGPARRGWRRRRRRTIGLRGLRDRRKCRGRLHRGGGIRNILLLVRLLIRLRRLGLRPSLRPSCQTNHQHGHPASYPPFTEHSRHHVTSPPRGKPTPAPWDACATPFGASNFSWE